MDCARVEELLSDHVEGGLHEILRSEVDLHLEACGGCRELREALVEVIGTLRELPEEGAPEGLVERVLASTRGLRPVPAPLPLVVRPAIVMPAWMQAAAAGFALIALGVLLMVLGPEAPTRAATQLVERSVDAGTAVMERKDRLVEDVRILGVVLTTAFEGRVEKVNERVEDYRRLLERRRGEPDGSSKRGGRTRHRSLRFAGGFRTGTNASS